MFILGQICTTYANGIEIILMININNDPKKNKVRNNQNLSIVKIKTRICETPQSININHNKIIGMYIIHLNIFIINTFILNHFFSSKNSPQNLHFIASS